MGQPKLVGVSDASMSHCSELNLGDRAPELAKFVYN